MRSETLEEVELTGVRPSLTAVRTFTRGNTGVEEVYVDTDNGPVCVAVQGDRSRPPILTYHDLGLNCKPAPSTITVRPILAILSPPSFRRTQLRI